MLEFQNKNNSKVKVVNVTEARGNFARILSDTKSHYIITKNNRAQRVIINFDEFKVLQELAQAYQNEHSHPSSFEIGNIGEPVASEEQSRKLKTSQPLKGMIAEQFKLSQPQKRKFDDESETSFAVATDQKNNVETLVDDVGEAPPVAATTLLTPSLEAIDGESDYFHTNTNSDDVEVWEDFLPEPTTQSHQQFIVDGVAVLPQTEENQAIIEHAAKTIVHDHDVAVTLPEPPPPRKPEEEEYFRRYRKLYEGFEIMPTPVATTDFPQIVLTPSQSVEEEKGFVHKTQTPVTETSLQESLTPQQPRVEKAHLTEPEIEQEGLPSLQELLKDLEAQKLSDEEDLASRDIDDIINRITSD